MILCFMILPSPPDHMQDPDLDNLDLVNVIGGTRGKGNQITYFP